MSFPLLDASWKSSLGFSHLKFSHALILGFLCGLWASRSLPLASLLFRSSCPSRKFSLIIWVIGNAQSLCPDSGSIRDSHTLAAYSVSASLCLFIFLRCGSNIEPLCLPEFTGIILRSWMGLFKIPLSGFGFRRWYSHPSLPRWARAEDTLYQSLQRNLFKYVPLDLLYP